MRHRQHQRGIGVRPDRDPLGVEKIGRIGLERTDGDEFDTGVLRTSQPHFHAVGAGAAGGHLTVLGGEAAEREHHARVLDDRCPVRDLADGRLECADHARQEILSGAEAVVADLVDAAAAEEQEPPYQAAGMMDAACRRPSIGAAEDRVVAERLAHACKLRGDRIQRLVPGHFVEAFGAGARLALTPAFADRRPCDPQRRVHHRGNGLEHARGRGIARKRLAADDAAVLDQRGEGAPMGQGREARDGHGVPAW